MSTCTQAYSITIADACDTFAEVTWTELIIDPDSATVISISGGDGTYLVALTGAPGHQGSTYRYTSNVMLCAQAYTATIEIDYNISFQDVGGGSSSNGTWQVRRNGILLLNQTKIAPEPPPGTLIESGTFSTGPFTMAANTNYTFQLDLDFGAVGVGTFTNASGAIRFRPLTTP